MEYRVDGIIRFHPGIQFKLEAPWQSITSASGARISLNPTNGSELAVVMILEADNEAATSDLAESELERISSHLSYLKNVPILGSEVGAIAPAASKSVTYLKRTDAKARIVKPIELGAEDMKALADQLANEYSQDLEAVISWWRVAISFKVPALKYIFLYSLMECLFRGKTKRLTDWITKWEPSVKMHPPNEHRDYQYTDYTYLRDSLHHRKLTGIPRQQDIDKLLPRFQDFVRKRITEIYGINYAW